MTWYDVMLAFVGIAIGGFLKGATGAGAPVVGVPILAIVFGLPKAVAVFSLLNLFSNMWQGWTYRAHMRGPGFTWKFAVAGAFGAAAGSVLLASLPTAFLMGTLALIVFLYIGIRFARPAWHLSGTAGDRLVSPVGFAAGVMQGAGGISAPISVTFLNALRMERPEFVGTISIFFLGMSILQIPTLVALEIMTWERFGLAVAGTIPLFGAMPVGEWAAKRVSKATFDKLILLLLAVIAVRLIYSALTGG